MSEEKEKYISPYQHLIDAHKRFKEALAKLPPEQAARLKDYDPYERVGRGFPYIYKGIHSLNQNIFTKLWCLIFFRVF